MAQAVCDGGRRILVIDFVWRVESVATKVIVHGPSPTRRLSKTWAFVPALQESLEGSLCCSRKSKGEESMKRLVLAIVSSAILMVAMAGAAAAATGPAPGTGLVGACNMLLDKTMVTIPMARAAAQGIAGMFHAVDVSGCSL